MNKKLQLDRLDREILEVFATDHPRPSSIGYCDYDVSEDEVQRLCVGIDPYNDTKLIDRFSWHVTLGMFGESKDFPPFAGYVAVVSRREGLNFPNEYRFFQLHIGSGGLFSTDAKRVIGLWAKDILYPWERPLSDRLWVGTIEHVVDILAIAYEFGLSPDHVIKDNLDVTKRTSELTPLIRSLCMHGESGFEIVSEHFEGWKSAFSGQPEPQDIISLVSTEVAAEIRLSLESNWSDISKLDPYH